MVYFDKAKELGNLLLESEEAKSLADANFEYSKDLEAQEKMKAYEEVYLKFQEDLQAQKIGNDEIKEKTEELTKMVEELRVIPSIAELTFSQSEFNELVNKTINIITATITGQDCDEDDCSTCGGCPSSN